MVTFMDFCVFYYFLEFKFKFKFKFIYSHLFSYNITTIKNNSIKKEVSTKSGNGIQSLLILGVSCFVFRGNHPIRQALQSCHILDMSNSRKLYQKA